MQLNRTQFPKHRNSSYKSVTENQTTPPKKLPEDQSRYSSKEDIQIANEHLRRRSMLLITGQIQIKTTTMHHLTQVRMAITKKSTEIDAGEGVQKRQLSYAVGRNAFGMAPKKNGKEAP